MGAMTDWVAHARERLIAAVRRHEALVALGASASEIFFAADMIDAEARALADALAERAAEREAR